jgi:hypothetical protein
MGGAHVVIDRPKSLSSRGPVVVWTALFVALAVVVGFAGGLILGRSQVSAVQPSSDLARESTPTAASKSGAGVVVLTNQPDGSVGCSHLSGQNEGGLVVYQWTNGSLNDLRCTSTPGGSIGLGYTP